MTLLIILLDALFGGTNTPLVKFTVAKLSPITVVFGRFLLAAIFISPLAIKEKVLSSALFKRDLFFANLLFAANIIIFVNAISHTSIIMAQLLYLFNAPIVAIIGYFFLKEKLIAKQIIGLILALSGLLILIEGSIRTKDVLSFGTPFGNSLVFLGVIAWSLYIVFSRKISKIYSPLKLTFHNFIITTTLALLLIPLDLQRYNLSPKLFTLGLVSALVALALFSTVLFFLFYQWIIKYTSAFISSLVNYLATLFAGLAGIIFFGEKLNSNFIVGTTLLLIGVYFASGNHALAKLSKN